MSRGAFHQQVLLFKEPATVPVALPRWAGFRSSLSTLLSLACAERSRSIEGLDPGSFHEFFTHESLRSDAACQLLQSTRIASTATDHPNPTLLWAIRTLCRALSTELLRVRSLRSKNAQLSFLEIALAERSIPTRSARAPRVTALFSSKTGEPLTSDTPLARAINNAAWVSPPV